MATPSKSIPQKMKKQLLTPKGMIVGDFEPVRLYLGLLEERKGKETAPLQLTDYRANQLRRHQKVLENHIGHTMTFEPGKCSLGMTKVHFTETSHLRFVA